MGKSMSEKSISVLCSQHQSEKPSSKSIGHLDATDIVEVYKWSLPSLLKLWALTASLGGAQFGFTSVLTYGRPHLQSLGFTDEVSVAVLLLIPLCGLVCQPIIGSYSDKCRTRIGSRTPFLLGVFVLTTVSAFAFSYSAEIGAMFVPGAKKDSLIGSAGVIARIIAVLSVVGAGVAQDINSACSRSLVVDKVPFSQQTVANAIAAISGALGGFSSYIVCSIDLPELFNSQRFTQLHFVSIITSFVSLFTISATVLIAREGRAPEIPEKRWYDPLKEIMLTLRHIPPPIRTLCNIQFFSSLPWYPILFFSSTWVEENTIDIIELEEKSDISERMSNAREAAIPLIVFSLSSLVSGIVLPLVISPSAAASMRIREGWRRVLYYPYVMLRQITSSMSKVWISSHILLFVSLCFTPLKLGLYTCLAILALVGYSWGIVQWIPFALLSELLIKLKQDHPGMLKSTAKLDCEICELPSGKGSNKKIDIEVKGSETVIDSGAVFGVHNIYIVIPQLISALVSLLVTHIIDEKFKHTIRGSSGWCMFATSWGALVAAYMIKKKIPKLDREYGLANETLDIPRDAIYKYSSIL